MGESGTAISTPLVSKLTAGESPGYSCSKRSAQRFRTLISCEMIRPSKQTADASAEGLEFSFSGLGRQSVGPLLRNGLKP